MYTGMQHKTVRLGVAGELDPEEIGDLAFVPADERARRRNARDGATYRAAPHKEIFPLPATGQIPQFQPAGRDVPGIGHLHPAAVAD